MKAVFVYILCLLFVAGAKGNHGKCDFFDYGILVHSCQGEFVGKLQNSKQPHDDCFEIFRETQNCLVNRPIAFCYKDNVSEEELKKITQEELKYFGSESTYCDFGGIQAIDSMFEDVEQDTCVEEVNETVIEKCEHSFYNEFRNNPSSPKLCNLSQEIHACQRTLLAACREISMTKFRDHYEPPYCLTTARDIEEKSKEILAGKSHATFLDVLIPLLVVSVVIVIGLCIGFCRMARNEPKQQNNVEQPKNTVQEQPKEEEAESVPLKTIVTTEVE
ncbi:uncharacterized protein LOC143469753 [Clavelina lepadiformis]|uniref:DUF19 domain-containing protein n=1 Tax=Clavelina lepadiformis TaxID=159417 RepID=A0ABP0F2R0_CLALP